MQCRFLRTTTAAVTTLVLAAGTASAQQTFQRGQQWQDQVGQNQQWQDQFERQRQTEMQRRFQQQQRQMQQQQAQARQQYDPFYTQDQGGPQDQWDYQGRFQDQWGSQQPGMGAQQQMMQRQPQQLRQQWMAVQQAQMRSEPRFEDLPLAPEARRTPTRVSQPTQIFGTVTETRTARLIGQPQPSQLIKIRTQDGATVFADLGSPQQVRHLQIRRGEQVQVSGTPTWLNNLPVVFANQIQTREGMASVQRHGGAQQFQQFRQPGGQQWQQQQRFQQTGLGQLGLDGPGVGQTAFITGTVSEKKEVTVGDSEPYLFAYLEDQQGRERLVNLGPAERVEDRVSEGDRIQVQAITMPLLGQTVYHANQVRINGESMRIQHVRDGRAQFQQTGLGQIGMDRPGVGQLTVLSGTITEKGEFTIGDSDPYLFAYLEDQQGQERLVNLGPAERIEDRVSEGDEIQVQAITMPLLGETVYHATQLRANGQTMRIQQVRDQDRMRLQQDLQQRYQQRQQQFGQWGDTGSGLDRGWDRGY